MTQTLEQIVEDCMKWQASEGYVDQNYLRRSYHKAYKLGQREGLRERLSAFLDWLHKEGEIDSDYYVEEPHTLDVYLAQLKEE